MNKDQRRCLMRAIARNKKLAMDFQAVFAFERDSLRLNSWSDGKSFGSALAAIIFLAMESLRRSPRQDIRHSG